MGGRRTKLDDDRIKAICAYVEEGLPYDTAARLAGVDPATFYRWRREGEKAKSGMKKKLVKAVEEANAKAQQELVRQVKMEKGGAKWILERRWPEVWGQKVDVTLEGSTVFAIGWGVEHGDEAATGHSGENA